MPISPLRKRVNSLLGLGLLAGLAVIFWPFVFGRGEMQQFCQSLPPGASLSQVRDLASAKGFEVSDPLDGRAFVHSSRSFGRFNCDLRFGNGGLQSSEYADNN